LSDRLALVHAIEEAAGVSREKAESVATAFADLIDDRVTRARREDGIQRLENSIERLIADLDRCERRVTTYLGAWMVLVFVLLFAALHMWPAH
jgi:hypothetical protein